MYRDLLIHLNKLLIQLLRRLNIGGGTALPGYILEKTYPDFGKDMSQHIENIILITGTNGKTTTANALEHILEEKFNGHVIRNKGGANLQRGIFSTLLEHHSDIKSKKIRFAIFETEEASLPRIVKSLNPNVLLVTNIFRDQLDAYGEIDKTAEVIKKGVKLLRKDSKLILNADDPRVNAIGESHQQTIRVTLNSGRNIKSSRDIGDSSRCPLCRSKLIYKKIYYSHIGLYKCPNCNFSNENSDYVVKEVRKKDSLAFKINDVLFQTQLDGFFNIYNLSLAIITAKEIGIPLKEAQDPIANIIPAFGRGEDFNVGKTTFRMLLVKNPTGMNNALDLITAKEPEVIVFGLNDNIADGKDVSWIWDCDMEKLKTTDIKTVYTFGKRSYDMALRLKYAGIDTKRIIVLDNIQEIFNIKSAQTAYILPTYTAMLELRSEFKKQGATNKDFWQ